MSLYLAPSLLLFCALWPLLNAVLLALPGSRSLARSLTPWAAVPALVAALALPVTPPMTVPGALLGSEIGLDATAKVFLLFTSLLWLAAGAYARSYIARPQQQRFYLYFLLTLAGNLGVIVAQDMLSFYFGYALMSFAAYGLIVFEGNAAAMRAGRVYILLMVASEVLVFAAFVLAANAAGGTSLIMVQEALVSADNRHLIIALMLAGFGVKAGLLGLHAWLPLAHSQAPTPASAVLSGAMVKVGVLAWLRLLPLGLATEPTWAIVFLVLGLAAAFYGVAVGLTQRHPKTVLAYSSISQMGIMTAAVGMALLAPATGPTMVAVITFYALQHSLNKGALFLGVGLANAQHRLSHWWLWLTLAIPALALAGSPWTSGMLAKLLLKKQTLELPAFWAQLLPLTLSIGSLATALLLARFLFLVRPDANAHPRRPALGLLVPWLLLLILAQLVPWLSTPKLPAFTLMTVINSAWPVATAILIGAAVVKWKLLRNAPIVPAGDLLSILASVAKRLTLSLSAALGEFERRQFRRYTNLMSALQLKMDTLLARAEQTMSQWAVAIALAIGLIALMAWQLR